MHLGEKHVKDLSKLLIAGFILSLGNLQADIGDDDALYVSESIADETTKPAKGPFTLEVNGNYIGKAEHQSHNNEDFTGNIRYNHEKVQFDAVVYYNQPCEEALALNLGYESTYINWNKNPFFKRKNYDTLTVAGTYITHRLSCWQWIVQGAVNIDADKWSLSEYNTYDMLLWGRYTWNDCIGLHFGVYAETGIKLDRVWPVLGFDWQISKQWLLNAIYPLNISLNYFYNDLWTLNLAVRFFNERHKAGESGGFENAIWRYQNSGAEFALINNWCSWLRTNLHAGYTFGGKLKIADSRAHHNRRFHFKSSPYFGAEITANF